MGLAYKSEENTAYPKGCYGYSDGILYFNTHATGGADNQSQPLCSSSSSSSDAGTLSGACMPLAALHVLLPVRECHLIHSPLLLVETEPATELELAP
jgi:hypothetical protein